jgi:fructoselysine 6-kinase
MYYPGGNTVNVAVLCRRLGADTGYVGCVGDDQGGGILREALAIEGVDIGHLRVRSGATARTFIGNEQGDRKFLRSAPGVRNQYAFDHSDDTYIASFDLVHTSIYSDLGSNLSRVRSAARRLSFDFSNKWNEAVLHELVPGLEVAFVSAADATDHDCARILETCIGFGARLAVATRGAHGAMASNGIDAQVQEALPTSVVDTLGAGDGFIAGFLVAHLAGNTLASAMARGARCAQRVCTWQGGFGHGVPWQDSTVDLGCVSAD